MTAADSLASDITLFISNISTEFTKNQVKDFIDQNGFLGTYDFLYVPRCFTTRKGKGYAFINFCVPGAAQRFIEAMDAAAMEAADGELVNRSPCWSVSLATKQGLEANVRKWVRRDGRLRDPENWPFVLHPDQPSAAQQAPPHEAAAAAGQQGAEPPGSNEVPIPFSIVLANAGPTNDFGRQIPPTGDTAHSRHYGQTPSSASSFMQDRHTGGLPAGRPGSSAAAAHHGCSGRPASSSHDGSAPWPEVDEALLPTRTMREPAAARQGSHPRPGGPIQHLAGLDPSFVIERFSL